MRIAVVDGQGGGIGKAIVEKLRAAFGEKIEILALGTNSLATASMIKSGASQGATGENAIIVNACCVDIITGTIGIIAADSMLGELTPSIARAIAQSPARKVLIPLSRCNIQVAGVNNEPLQYYIDSIIQIVKGLI